MAHACDTSVLEAEAGGWLWVQGQPRLHSELLSRHTITVSKRECIEMDPVVCKAIS